MAGGSGKAYGGRKRHSEVRNGREGTCQGIPYVLVTRQPNCPGSHMEGERPDAWDGGASESPQARPPAGRGVKESPEPLP